jgi:hypothetical protein
MTGKTMTDAEKIIFLEDAIVTLPQLQPRVTRDFRFLG